MSEKTVIFCLDRIQQVNSPVANQLKFIYFIPKKLYTPRFGAESLPIKSTFFCLTESLMSTVAFYKYYKPKIVLRMLNKSKDEFRQIFHKVGTRQCPWSH